jgi:glycine C-acetyltransferase
MYASVKPVLENELAEIHSAGLHKGERIITSRQGRVIQTEGKEVLNFCANNYLGLAGTEEMVDAARGALDTYGFGLSSTRFICGTQDIHKELEIASARFLGMEDSILYSSCMAANIGFFGSFLTDQDVILSNSLNHASIIDGGRMCRAPVRVFKHMDMGDLEEGLRGVQDKRIRCVVTDGVFSMDGDIAPLRDICDLSEEYGALVVVDDSHSTGFMGENGHGTAEHWGVEDRVDVITSTYGKALGGAGGGFIAGPQAVVDILRERSRTYIFSNTLPSVISAPTSSRTPCHRSSAPRLCSPSPTSRTTPSFARGYGRTRTISGRGCKKWASPSPTRCTPSCRSCSVTPRKPREWRRKCSTRESTSSVSASRWSPKAKPASGSRFPASIPPKTWTGL